MIKMDFKFIIIFFFMISILTNCRWNDASLGNNYFYLNQYNAIDNGFPEGAIIYKSPEENVFQDIKVYGNVVSINFNDNFIVAKRIAKDKPTDTSYYIIVKRFDKIIGPLNLDSYKQTRTKLKIRLKL